MSEKIPKPKILENELEWRRLKAGRLIGDHYIFFSQIEYLNVLRKVLFNYHAFMMPFNNIVI